MTHPRNVTPWAAAILCGVALSTAGCNLSPGASTQDPGSTWVEGDTTTVSTDMVATADASEVERLLAAARGAEANGEFRQAGDLYGQALAADPGNPDARLGRTRINANLGMRMAMADPADDSEDISGTAAEITEVRRDQMRMEAESRIKQGEVAMSAGEYAKAITAFEDALLIVRHNPFLEGVGLTQEGVQMRLDGAKTAKVESERQEDAARAARIMREKTEREREERERLANRIVILFKSANKAFQDDRFSEAEGYLTEILRLDPANKEATDMRLLARDAGRQALDQEQTRSMKQNWRKSFDEMTALLNPQMTTIMFPEENAWRTIAERGPITFSVAEDVTSPEEKAIVERLSATPITLAFNDVPLTEAMDWFKSLTNVNFVLSSTVADAGGDQPFSINAGPMPAMDALQLLLGIAEPPLKYRIQDGVVRILGAEEASGDQVLEIYDVRDISVKLHHFPAKDYNLLPSSFSADEVGGEPPEDVEPWEDGKLQELITNNIAPESWTADPLNEIQTVGGSLVVRQTPDVQRMIRRLIDDLRTNMGTLINIESRFITVTDSFLEDIGLDFRGLGPDSVNPDAGANIPPGLSLDDFGSIPDGFGTPNQPSGTGTDNDVGIFDTHDNGDIKARTENLYDTLLGNQEFTNAGGLSLQGTFLDETLAQIVVRAVSKYGMSNITDAPALTLYNNQRANISMINHVSYVSDFDVEIAQAAVIGQPIVRILQEGVVLDVRPVVSADKRFITMELRPSVADLKRPIDTFTTSLSIGSDVTIELPILRIKRARTTVTMPDGATLVLGGWKVVEDQDFESGVPFLSKVPLLTTLFTRKGKFLDKRKLVILVKAKVVIPEEHEPVYGLGQ